MDLTKRTQISREDRLEVSQAMQLIILDEIARKVAWKIGDAAFHGGTSISSAWSSQRWSEDLDFLLSRDQRKELMAAARSIAAALRLRMDLQYPGSTVEFEVKVGDENKQDVLDVWTVKWNHRNRIGKVMVKAEFYATEPGLLAAYRATLARPGAEGSNISVVMPVGDLVSLWGDKVKVLATRTGFKWRDVHDLGYVAGLMDRRGWPDPQALFDALVVSSSIYQKEVSDVAEGLRQRIEEGRFGNVDEFTMDMALWFPKDLHQDMASRGLFSQLISRSKAEVERALELISEMGYRPGVPR